MKPFSTYMLSTGPLAYTPAASTATMSQQQHKRQHVACVTTHSLQSQGLPWISCLRGGRLSVTDSKHIYQNPQPRSCSLLHRWGAALLHLQCDKQCTQSQVCVQPCTACGSSTTGHVNSSTIRHAAAPCSGAVRHAAELHTIHTCLQCLIVAYCQGCPKGSHSRTRGHVACASRLPEEQQASQGQQSVAKPLK